MTTRTDQLTLETTWSTRLVDDIVLESITGNIPTEMQASILGNITHLNTHNLKDNKEIFIRLFSLVLKDRVARPIQAIATQIGMSSGIESAPHAFVWGWLMLKECRDSGLYNIKRSDDNLYAYPGYGLSYEVKQRLAKLQY